MVEPRRSVGSGSCLDYTKDCLFRQFAGIIAILTPETITRSGQKQAGRLTMDSAENHQMLQEKHCRPCERGMPPLDKDQIAALLLRLEGWKPAGNGISKTYQFKNFHQTMAFVNAVAWIAHREGHHPDLRLGFNRCEISYTTHAIAGLSENDFICAAKVDALLTGQEG